VLHGAQPARTTIGTELSPPVAAALDPLAAAVAADLALYGCRSRGEHRCAQGRRDRIDT
jgi:hypothetical protein